MEMFYPKPGDTIVCRNGKEYTCVSKDDYISKDIYPDHVIFAHVKGSQGRYGNHNCWEDNTGEVPYARGFDIVKVIPTKVEVCSITAVLAALEALGISHPGEEILADTLKKVVDPDYPKYLELKKKFEGEKL